MSEISKQALLVDNSTSFPNNNAGAITPADLRAFNVNLIQSTVNQTEYTENSSSWNSKISQLNAFTASQQPSFTALNSFTASQIITNTNLNSFTQSANQELDSLSAWTGSWNAWTSSINEIRDNGVLQGYSTRLFFSGLVSASIVTNVDGPIASINVEQDGTKLNTSSFNSYTASAAASQSLYSASVATSINGVSSSLYSVSASQATWNASATASISQLLSFSSSLDATFATDAQLAAVSASLNETKLNTSSFNSYTASQSLLNGTFATTGSNIFVGDQTIFKADGKLTFQSGSSNTADVRMTSAGGLQLSVQNTQIGLLEQNAITLQKNTTINGTLRTNDSYNLINQYGNINVMRNTNFSGSQYPLGNMIVAPNQYPGDVYGGWIVTTELGNQAGQTFLGMVANSYSPQYGSTTTPMIIGGGNNPAGSDTAIGFPTNGQADHWKVSNFKYGVNISGSTTLTGSVYGNISELTISGVTASMDLSKSNFFTLNLVSGSTTHLTATNIKAGQTINLLITQPSVGTGSLSYNSTFDFPAGANYIATPITSSKDIITFITFDTSTIYATSINNLR
jgi:hypothetical protein